jgi:thymidylate kinase
MSQLLTPASEPAAPVMPRVDQTPTQAATVTLVPTAERTLLGMLDAFAGAGIPFWIIDGYGGGTFDPVDIDILVPRRALGETVVRAVRDACQRTGATLISWDRDNQFVLACGSDEPRAGVGDSPSFLRIHLRPDYRRVGRFFYDGDDVLAARKPPAVATLSSPADADSFSTPSTAKEFGCYLIEKIVKSCLSPTHERVLSKVFANDPDGCATEIARFWSSANAALIASAARDCNWEVVRRAQPELRTELRRGAFARRPIWTVKYKLSKGVRKIVEFLRPSSGLHVVMLGPDGVGKSTVVEALERDLASAFCGIRYNTFAPQLLPRKPATPGGQPHGLPPRSWAASVVKGVWWIVFYSLGYHYTIRPILARGGLALNHRYCVDALVDCRRYRYAGPQWLLRLAWRLARKPDLIFVLDAPPEVVQARKKEVAFEETVRQRDAYKAIVARTRNGHVIDSTQRVVEVVGDVERVIFKFMAARAERRLGTRAN